jgi:PadR family transcriptional regulator, regulatory protein PadR
MKGESYGLELIDRVYQLTGGRLKLMQGRVYPVLRELEREGLLRSFEGQALPERGGRPRRYYEITAEGRRVARMDAKAVLALVHGRVWAPR